MKTENLAKALQGFEQFLADLRHAHTDAVKSDNEFAEIALLSILEDATSLATKLRRAASAAGTKPAAQ